VAPQRRLRTVMAANTYPRFSTRWVRPARLPRRGISSCPGRPGCRGLRAIATSLVGTARPSGQAQVRHRSAEQPFRGGNTMTFGRQRSVPAGPRAFEYGQGDPLADHRHMPGLKIARPLLQALSGSAPQRRVAVRAGCVGRGDQNQHRLLHAHRIRAESCTTGRIQACWLRPEGPAGERLRRDGRIVAKEGSPAD